MWDSLIKNIFCPFAAIAEAPAAKTTRTVKGISIHIPTYSPVSKELRQNYYVRAMPIQKDDKGQQIGKVGKVYRKKHVIYNERVQPVES